MKNDLIKLCLDASRGNVQNYSAKESSEVIRNAFIELMGTDKPDYRTFRKHAPEVFEILEVVIDDIVTQNLLGSPFFQQFVEYRDLNLGDKNEFYAPDNSTLVISEIADGHLNLRRQRLNSGASFSVGTKVYGAKVYGEYLAFISGRLDWASLVAKIEQALNIKLAGDIYTAFTGASTYLPSVFKTTGTFSDATFTTLLQHVQAANGYAPVVIAGTKQALKKIGNSYSATSFLVSENMKNDIHQNGFLNAYDGVPLLEIPQVHVANDANFTFKLDDTKLMILPANTKPIKFVREGQSIIVENNGSTPNMDMSLEHTFITRWGIATIFNHLYGQYTLS